MDYVRFQLSIHGKLNKQKCLHKLNPTCNIKYLKFGEFQPVKFCQLIQSASLLNKYKLD